MNASDTSVILNQMINVVLRQLDEEKLELSEDSFFAEELRKIPKTKRRELIQTYLCDKTFLLLQGIIDQVHSLNSMLSVPSPAVVEISPYILARTMLEYSSKLAYLTDPNTSERIPRTLRCLYADIQEFRKLPEDLVSPTGRMLAEDRFKVATEWYRELTGGEGKIRAVRVLEIFEELAGEKSDVLEKFNWVEDGKGSLVPLTYSKGYRIFSAVAHGNSWAVQHYGVTKFLNDAGEIIERPGLDSKTVNQLQVLAGGHLIYSLGFATQFIPGHLPHRAMNELEELNTSIRDALIDE